MSPEQSAFWKPYTDLIGLEDFQISKPRGGMPGIVRSKHYCGIDASALGANGKGVREVAINKYLGYQEILSQDKLTADDINLIFLSYVEKYFLDKELVQILTKRGTNLSLDEHWELVIDCWCLQEFTTNGGRGENWRIIFNHREKPLHLTSELPDNFMAYRAGNESGFSWTLDKKIAQWFHKRFKSEFGDIPFLTREFKKTDAVFYTNIRNEKEVVILSSF